MRDELQKESNDAAVFIPYPLFAVESNLWEPVDGQVGVLSFPDKFGCNAWAPEGLVCLGGKQNQEPGIGSRDNRHLLRLLYHAPIQRVE